MLGKTEGKKEKGVAADEIDTITDSMDMNLQTLIKDSEGFKCKKLDQLRNEQDKKDPIDENSQNSSQRKNIKDCLSTCERLKNKEVLVSNI